MSGKIFELAVTDFTRSVGLLVRRARTASASEQLSWTEVAVLKHLVREGSATTADLARTQGMRPQSMRPIIATLEGLGMVSRTPHSTDGRQVSIGITAEGIAAQTSAGRAKQTWIAQAISQLDPADREILFAAGEIIKRLAEKP